MIKLNEHSYALAPLQPDEGVQFGRAVFETMPVFEKPVFFLEHISRLNRGLEALRIREPVNPVWLDLELKKLHLRHCVLKIIVSEKNLILQTRALPEKKTQVKLTLQPDWRSRHPMLLQHKTVQYLAGLLAWETARDDGYDDALLINPAGYIAEASRSNIFLIRNDKLYTPDLACGLLPGIIRDWVIRSYPVETGFYTPDDLFTSAGAFICNSVVGILPVQAVDDHLLSQSDQVNEIARQYDRQTI